MLHTLNHQYTQNGFSPLWYSEVVEKYSKRAHEVFAWDEFLAKIQSQEIDIHSSHFQKILSAIWNHDSSISQSLLAYNKQEIDIGDGVLLTAEDFKLLCEYIFRNNILQQVDTEMFSTSYVDFAGIRFTLFVWQWSEYCAESLENIRKKNLGL